MFSTEDANIGWQHTLYTRSIPNNICRGNTYQILHKPCLGRSPVGHAPSAYQVLDHDPLAAYTRYIPLLSCSGPRTSLLGTQGWARSQIPDHPPSLHSWLTPPFLVPFPTGDQTNEPLAQAAMKSNPSYPGMRYDVFRITARRAKFSSSNERDFHVPRSQYTQMQLAGSVGLKTRNTTRAFTNNENWRARSPYLLKLSPQFEFVFWYRTSLSRIGRSWGLDRYNYQCTAVTLHTLDGLEQKADLFGCGD